MLAIAYELKKLMHSRSGFKRIKELSACLLLFYVCVSVCVNETNTGNVLIAS